MLKYLKNVLTRYSQMISEETNVLGDTPVLQKISLKKRAL